MTIFTILLIIYLCSFLCCLFGFAFLLADINKCLKAHDIEEEYSLFSFYTLGISLMPIFNAIFAIVLVLQYDPIIQEVVNRELENS